MITGSQKEVTGSWLATTWQRQMMQMIIKDRFRENTELETERQQKLIN